jgi:nucleoside 2-deoxyribosyltransferase
MKAYISVSFNRRQGLDKELKAIEAVLSKLGIDPFVFVDNHKFDITQEQEMMKQATADIDKCDILIAETSDKGIGIGIEVGYAKAKMKPIIYLRHKTADHSTTVSGISDFQIIYENISDLQEQLGNTIVKAIASNDTHKL